jgi:hypothetical protein
MLVEAKHLIKEEKEEKKKKKVFRPIKEFL